MIGFDKITIKVSAKVEEMEADLIEKSETRIGEGTLIEKTKTLFKEHNRVVRFVVSINDDMAAKVKPDVFYVHKDTGSTFWMKAGVFLHAFPQVVPLYFAENVPDELILERKP
jgi:hypothetical protein